LPIDDPPVKMSATATTTTTYVEPVNFRQVYGEVEGKYVTFRQGGRPGRRLIRHRGDPGWIETFDRIPVIDFTNVDHPDIEVRRKLATELADAAENVGFWYAANTPVTEDLRDETFHALETFFAMPTEEKLKVSWLKSIGTRGYESFAEVDEYEGSGKKKSNLRESFNVGEDLTDPVQYSGPLDPSVKPQNQWPESLPQMKATLDKYLKTVLPFAHATLRLFALALGLEEDALDKLHVDPLWAMRCQHYPPQDPAEEGNGFLAHSDFSTFTFVLQGPKYGSGLEVLNPNGQWVSAPFVPGTTFTCNVGDYLQHLSDGRFSSTVHRVINRSGKERYSLPFFFRPNPSSKLVPLIENGGERKTQVTDYESKTVGEHFVRRILTSRPFHPTTKRLRELNIPEEEWKFEYTTGACP